jgi:hypothetical protein
MREFFGVVLLVLICGVAVCVCLTPFVLMIVAAAAHNWLAFAGWLVAFLLVVCNVVYQLVWN